jgi:hypothetical protein
MNASDLKINEINQEEIPGSLPCSGNLLKKLVRFARKALVPFFDNVKRSIGLMGFESYYQVENFSTMYAARPRGDVFSPTPTVSGFVACQSVWISSAPTVIVPKSLEAHS